MKINMAKIFRNQEMRRDLRLLIKFVEKYRKNDWGFYKPGDEIPTDEFIYRHIIYTLLLANLETAHWIIKFEPNMPTQFPILDMYSVARAMFERYINQEYILTEPKRLAKLYILWREIENYKFLNSYEKLSKDDGLIAVTMMTRRTFGGLSKKEIAEYNNSKIEWETLVIPNQRADKARSWSGLSLAEMSKQTGNYEHYILLYRFTSWYAHGLAPTTDHYFEYDSEKPEQSAYTFDTDLDDIYELYFWVLVLLFNSFEVAKEGLDLNVPEDTLSVIDNPVSKVRIYLDLVRDVFESFIPWR